MIKTKSERKTFNAEFTEENLVSRKDAKPQRETIPYSR